MEYKLDQMYVDRFQRLQAAYKEKGDDISIPGLMEQAISQFLYDTESYFDIAPRVLPIVEMNGKRYFADPRLREYRNVEDPNDKINFLPF